ncbi:MAG: hypothetical protein H0W88_01820 [Parachlamydiaceae bacterium]|nr:hypothetical protein [Parachlamydiaceae bacterium]
MQVSSTPLSFNVAHEMDKNGMPRLYYLIGGPEVQLIKYNSFWEQLATKQDQNGTGLEIRDLESKEYDTFQLLGNYKGKVVFVQKHKLDDPDYTPGTHPGYNALETFEKVSQISNKILGQFNVDASASLNMNKFIESVTKINQNIGMNLFNDVPAYCGSAQVVEKMEGLLKKETQKQEIQETVTTTVNVPVVATTDKTVKISIPTSNPGILIFGVGILALALRIFNNFSKSTINNVKQHLFSKNIFVLGAAVVIISIIFKNHFKKAD